MIPRMGPRTQRYTGRSTINDSFNISVTRPLSLLSPVDWTMRYTFLFIVFLIAANAASVMFFSVTDWISSQVRTTSECCSYRSQRCYWMVLFSLVQFKIVYMLHPVTDDISYCCIQQNGTVLSIFLFISQKLRQQLCLLLSESCGGTADNTAAL